MSRYWENETPETITTNKNVLQYYRQAGKLSIARLPWQDQDGKERQGKTVCFDVEALLQSGAPALKDTRTVLAGIVEEIDRTLGE